MVLVEENMNLYSPTLQWKSEIGCSIKTGRTINKWNQGFLRRVSQTRNCSVLFHKGVARTRGFQWQILSMIKQDMDKTEQVVL